MTNSSSSYRPSQSRRDRLRANLSVPQVSNFFALDRYYDAADKVYESFQIAFQTSTFGDTDEWEKKRDEHLNHAYVFGKRYCIFCMEQLPNHGYYGMAKYAPRQRQHNKQMLDVVEKLEKVAAIMDTYEEYKMKAAAELAQKQALQREKEHQAKISEFQERLKKQQLTGPTNGTKNGTVAASALDKLQRLGGPGQTSRMQRDPSGQEPMGQPSTKYSMPPDDDDDDAIPPPMLPPGDPTSPSSSFAPSAPPSYEELLGSQGVKEGFINGERVNGVNPETDGTTSTPLLSYDSDAINAQKTKEPKKKIPVQTLQRKFEADYRRLVSDQKITIRNLRTYQGRSGASTNGCTVISALVVARHLKAEQCIDDAGIEYVIDSMCGPILKTIRSKLGLGGHALIIPSDVHDHLVDKKLLPQDKFMGAAGGNVMDEHHLNEFIKILAQARNRGGATLFFREHVISIVKYYDKDVNSYCYDLIDSLPSVAGKASRTRCIGLEALFTLVKWYTSKKFSSSDCRYVDKNEWEDNLADVDPRVFQGFVWGDAPQ